MDRKLSSRSVIEAASAVGIVASLVFVGMEVRQNTAAIRGSAIQEMAAQSVEFVTAWTTDENFPRILAQALDGALPDDFSAEDDMRLRLGYITAIRTYESRFLQVKLGILDEDIFEQMAGNANFYHLPYLKAAWPTLQAQVGPEFRAFFSERFDLE